MRASFAIILTSALAADAFSAVGNRRPALLVGRSTVLEMAKLSSEGETLRAFGTAAFVAFGLIFNAADVPAMSTTVVQEHSTSALHSSSIQLSKEIQTMDMSMPGSYDSIAAPTVSGSDELSQTENVLTGGTRKKAPSSTKSKNGGAGGGKQLTPEEKAEIAAQKQAEREAAAAEKVALAAEKAKEKELLAAEKAAEKEAAAAEKAAQRQLDAAEKAKLIAEKAAKKEAEAASKAAKAEEKEREKLFKGAEVVDMSLPSYEKSATITKEKNPYAL